MPFNRGFRDDSRRFPREMHKIKCSKCGKDAEVPFKPSGDRPVYCKECFMKSKGISPRKEATEEAVEEKEETEEAVEEKEETEEESETEEETEEETKESEEEE